MAKRTNHGKKKDTESRFRKGNKSDNRNVGRDESRRHSNSRGNGVYPNDTISKDNDVNWYVTNEQMLRDAASISYAYPLGVPFDIDSTYYPNLNPMWTDNSPANINSLPGIMAIQTVPAPGISLDPNSPVNMAARNIYSFVRHANSGHSNYEAPDLMLYLLAMDSAYSYFAYMARIYGVLNLYAQNNRYYPKGMLYAMGVNHEDLLTHISDLRAYINTYAYKLGAMCVPDTMSYMKRHFWMYMNYFVDGNSRKAQTYLYVPAVLYQFTPTELTTGGALRPLSIVSSYPDGYMPSGQGHSFEDLRTIGNAILDPIIRDEDMNIMSGDILKAFGADKVMKISTIPEDFTVMPTFSMEVLSQIHNTTLNADVRYLEVDNENSWIYQDEHGVIKFNPVFQGIGYFGDRILDMYKDDVTPGDTMVATRMMNTALPVEGHDYKYRLASCGSEFAMSAYVFTWNRLFNRDDIYLTWTKHNYARLVDVVSDSTAAAATVNGVMQDIGSLTPFSMHPMVRFFSLNQDGLHMRPWSWLCETDNYTVISENALYKMHQTALLSQFDVPAMGAWSNKVK